MKFFPLAFIFVLVFIPPLYVLVVVGPAARILLVLAVDLLRLGVTALASLAVLAVGRTALGTAPGRIHCLGLRLLLLLVHYQLARFALGCNERRRQAFGTGIEEFREACETARISLFWWAEDGVVEATWASFGVLPFPVSNHSGDTSPSWLVHGATSPSAKPRSLPHVGAPKFVR
jgi:hypothetical protein